MKHVALILAAAVGSTVVQAGEIDPSNHGYWSASSSHDRTEVVTEYGTDWSNGALAPLGEATQLDAVTGTTGGDDHAGHHVLLASDIQPNPWTAN